MSAVEKGLTCGVPTCISTSVSDDSLILAFTRVIFLILFK